VEEPTADERWLGATPEAMADHALDGSRRRFEWALDDLRVLAWAGAISAEVSDPERAQRNRLERDALLAADAVRAARRLLEVDGTRDAAAVADEVAEHFAPYL
jgi:hypothetical protein